MDKSVEPPELSSGASFTRFLSLLEESCRLSDRFSAGSGDSAETPQRRVVIQTHDFPDHDAVASAFALSQLLERYGFTPKLLYRGIIRSYSLWSMISQLAVPITQVTGKVSEEWRQVPCVLVDGNPTNTNARQITEKLFGVIDHHGNSETPDCPFVDIRTDSGSCSSIIESYWHELGLSPDRVTATALLMGIQMDTDFLSRRVHPADLDALHRIFFTADWEYGSRVVKTALSKKDLNSLQLAIANARIQEGLFFTVISEDTTQEVISILADFFLRLREISITVLVENKGEIRPVSVRSQLPEVSAARVIRTALKDIGEGGGHDYMAGGLLSASTEISDDELFERFLNAIKEPS
ncbi:DHH superfamily protein, subfamily 1 [Treponema primitia ZAS-2]|uniref:DHH superfamily protein, subfamily 1 n=1 Tax=Treponema primitia (strain ATCC BAA-887 / DSM 12427 / ZAS-2) TaxID=545694 RepID=F5YN08_TREPZ|nr:DHHA1 domain-containing protein [Treponema primitia]AEF83870.1 DHH superfamily protein, subfamily 1 [Treponema primitia ZAS-2]